MIRGRGGEGEDEMEKEERIVLVIFRLLWECMQLLTCKRTCCSLFHILEHHSKH